MRFPFWAANRGTGDWIFGPASTPEASGTSCGGAGYTESFFKYELFDGGERRVAENFGPFGCTSISWAAEPSSPFDCSFLGFPHGSYRDYGSQECEWLDVTTVPAGDYSLRITINPEGLTLEKNAEDNVLEVQVQIPVRDPLVPCQAEIDATPAEELRECGWSLLTVTGGSGCAENGSVRVVCEECREGPLRACEGLRPCSSGTALPLDVLGSRLDCAGTESSVSCAFPDCFELELPCPYTLMHSGPEGTMACRVAAP